MQTKIKNIFKKSIDVVLTVLLLFSMAYQVTGEELHEWLGIGMTALLIVHHILNVKWYGALLKGKYSAYRITLTALNTILFVSIAMTAICGMSMSIYAVPFMYGKIDLMFARKMHLAMSYWSFILMGIHIGFHVKTMTAKLADKAKIIFTIISAVISSIGLWLFLKNGIANYIFFKTHFALLDYEKSKSLIFLENLAMLVFWVFAGSQLSKLLQKSKDKKISVKPLIWLSAVIIIGIVPSFAIGSNKDSSELNTSDWQATLQTMPQDASEQDTTNQTEVHSTENLKPQSLNDGFILINGGSFKMGSPDTENWRINDETQHEVTISSFYVDAYETTQDDYEQLMHNNPSTFIGADLPVDNVSWLDAVQYANARSEAEKLAPAYIIMDGEVKWDRSANGYRLPTEADWEFACRAGTNTPFNMEKSLSADDANFYGHYPYEIEENYFNDSVLEARPGEYRETTLSVGSFEPNAWGLYDCHGNVNEWCWDYYGEYDTAQTNNPTGAESGTCHIYRGGGWNDFAKNMRSAYRAAGQADMKSYNIGIRLVRNADDSFNEIITAKEAVNPSESTNNALIVYFSWGGNTRGVAHEIQRQTDFDIVELTLVEPYSTDYNTVLMEAQEDQHNQSRPELNENIDNMEQYDTIILGYPNWWASIPMPIATFLESYDLSDKRIMPFCSHGGGRFGQSLTAIAKLAPDSEIVEGLSIHYSGGSDMPDNVSEWLDENGI